MAWVFAEEEIFNRGSNKCISVRTQLKRLSKEVFQMRGSWEVDRGDVVAQGLWQQGTRQGGEKEGKDCACRLWLTCLKPAAVPNDSKSDAGFPYLSC